ncbi:hypothetical protein BHE74_00038837 [Ensete ventricosum]|nr:hypothetical protein GW17_00056185 [Ensete ventricosum]RWW54578.1 hypothetical protein BHE74_00038837 [Ensete ventricosum]
MASTTTADSLRVDREKDWDFHLRSLSSNARDSSSASDPASDPYILQSVCLRAPYLLPFDSASSRLSRGIIVKKIYEIAREGGSEELVARAYPQINKLFQRCVSALPQSQTSNGALLLVGVGLAVLVLFWGHLNRWFCVVFRFLVDLGVKVSCES